MVHGRLLPLAAVFINLHLDRLPDTLKRQSRPASGFLRLRQPHGNFKQAAVLQDAPVALQPGIPALFHKPLYMEAQAGCKTFQKILRYQAAVLKIADGLRPRLSPQAGFQHAPGSGSGLFIQGHPVHPVIYQPQKALYVFFIPGQPPGLSQTDEISVAVKLPDKFRISRRCEAPVDILRKGHRLIGPLHIPA